MHHVGNAIVGNRLLGFYGGERGRQQREPRAQSCAPECSTARAFLPTSVYMNYLRYCTVLEVSK